MELRGHGVVHLEIRGGIYLWGAENDNESEARAECGKKAKGGVLWVTSHPHLIVD